ncbi:MAG: RNA-binding S4 domain-containing protein [Shewanella sp.]|uniref:RNA-binding S4 domain-containing protein n=1 Tax=Shewanella sp. SNU WT4 TaxID=2590015 RepID=UPI00112E8220|nr:RNA-binding S4 domain-containing protein [Shewanella sp. SNU WT4]QDF66704.1 RNA-binding S4 domain-containing protein [Shewanella sp. SNU WT4]
MSDNIEQLPLRAGDEFVELYKVLKIQGWVDGGGDAKHLISEGQVKVNGVVETRKRKKLVVGDKIQFNGESVVISAAQ